jgi:hypothetical protein
MACSICNWTSHHKGGPGVVCRIARGGNLLIRSGEQNWGLNHVLCIWAELQNITRAGGVEGNVQTVGDGVSWVWGDTPKGIFT